MTTYEIDRAAGVTAPSGFRAAGVAAGIKASGRRDLALVVNDGPEFVAAGVFTTNKVKAAPVVWSAQVLRERRLQAVVLNSGGANACTGPGGFQDAHATAEKVAAALTAAAGDVGAGEVAVCSTGLIGDRLPMGRLLPGVDAAVAALTPDGGGDAAEAIMTTDKVAKSASTSHPDGWTVGGMAKGAGMIAPSLATMLAVITTDAVVDADAADAALRAATGMTFDRLDVDGAMSTNDTVLLLASGASGVHASREDLAAAVLAVCDDLAAQMQGDAEGVTKRVALTVRGAASEADALVAARAVARDNLVKTAFFGSDPNWGRVLAAVGAAPIAMEPDLTCVFFNGEPVCIDGMGAPGAREVDLSGPEIVCEIDLGTGGVGEATIRTTDLSHAYVEENSAYSS